MASSRRKARRFVVEKDDVIQMLYRTGLTTTEVVAIEAKLCDIVNAYLDDNYPTWRPDSSCDVGSDVKGGGAA